MASAPRFYVTPRIGRAVLDTGDTTVDGVTAVTVVAGVAGGTKVEEIDLIANGSNVTRPADSVVRLFLTDGTTVTKLHDIDVGAPVAASTTVTGYEAAPWTPENLYLPSASWSIKATVTVTPTAGSISVQATVLDA